MLLEVTEGLQRRRPLPPSSYLGNAWLDVEWNALSDFTGTHDRRTVSLTRRSDTQRSGKATGRKSPQLCPRGEHVPGYGFINKRGTALHVVGRRRDTTVGHGLTSEENLHDALSP